MAPLELLVDEQGRYLQLLRAGWFFLSFFKLQCIQCTVIYRCEETGHASCMAGLFFKKKNISCMAGRWKAGSHLLGLVWPATTVTGQALKSAIAFAIWQCMQSAVRGSVVQPPMHVA